MNLRYRDASYSNLNILDDIVGNEQSLDFDKDKRHSPSSKMLVFETSNWTLKPKGLALQSKLKLNLNFSKGRLVKNNTALR
jgi:hypothetical protein